MYSCVYFKSTCIDAVLLENLPVLVVEHVYRKPQPDPCCVGISVAHVHVLVFLTATVTAALSNMGTISSLFPLPSINTKPPSLLGQPNTVLEEVKKKVAKQANSMSIKEFTEVRVQI